MSVEIETHFAEDSESWRNWLSRHGTKKKGVWLVFLKRDAANRGVGYEDAVDEALCFGWIDSIVKRIDDQRYVRKFTPRRIDSVWSATNIERAKDLIRKGKITKPGRELFNHRPGKISDAERFRMGRPVVPREFTAALRRNPQARRNYRRFSPSNKQRYLLWITSAKKPETRKRRAAEAVLLISRNKKSLLK